MASPIPSSTSLCALSICEKLDSKAQEHIIRGSFAEKRYSSSLSFAFKCAQRIGKPEIGEPYIKHIVKLFISKHAKQEIELEKRLDLHQKYALDIIGENASGPKIGSSKNDEMLKQFKILFSNQKQHKNPLFFVQTNYYEDHIKMDKDFLFEAEQHKLCSQAKKRISELEQLQSSKDLSLETMKDIFSYTLENMIFQFYGLKASLWQPALGISFLHEQLRIQGPLLVRGTMGSNYYEDSPILQVTRDEACYYSWDPKAKRIESEKTNFVLICGINVDTRMIYFRDYVNDQRSEKNKIKKIYVISFECFLSQISDLNGKKSHLNEEGNVFFSRDLENNFVLCGYGFENKKWKRDEKGTPAIASSGEKL